MADEAPPPAPPEGGLRKLRTELQRQLRRPLVGLGLVAFLIVVIFPRMGPTELTVVSLPPTAKCGQELVLSLYQGETLSRRHTEVLGGANEVKTVLSVPKGEYRLQAVLGCAGERSPTGPDAHEERVVLEESREVELDLSGLCPCLKR